MENSLLNQLLQRSKDTREIIGVREYNDDDKFSSGYVEDFNDRLLTLRHFSKFGKPDGVIVFRRENVECMDCEDDYAKAMTYLAAHADELDNPSPVAFELSENEEWRTGLLQQCAARKDRIFGIEVGDGVYYAFIVQVTDTDFKMHCVDNIGVDEAYVIRKTEDVIGFVADTLECRKRELLFRWRKSMEK